MHTEYTCREISGDYAILVTDDGKENQVALALLPPETEVGTRLARDFFDWSVISV